VQFVLAQDQEHRQRGTAGERVGGERPARPHRAQQDARNRRADQAAELENRGVHADGIAQVGRPHEFIDKNLPGRLVQHRDQAQGQGKRVHVPDLDALRECQGSKTRGQDRGRPLAQHQNSPFGEAVRHHAAPRSEKQRGQELQRHRDADGGDGAGELEHQPVLGNALHPQRYHRYEVSGREDAEVADLERDKGMPPRQPLTDDADRLGDGLPAGLPEGLLLRIGNLEWRRGWHGGSSGRDLRGLP